MFHSVDVAPNTKTLLVFPQAYLKVIKTGESSWSTSDDEMKVYASDTNQSGRKPEPEAEVWRRPTGASVKKY